MDIVLGLSKAVTVNLLKDIVLTALDSESFTHDVDLEKVEVIALGMYWSY